MYSHLNLPSLEWQGEQALARRDEARRAQAAAARLLGDEGVTAVQTLHEDVEGVSRSG